MRARPFNEIDRRAKVTSASARQVAGGLAVVYLLLIAAMNPGELGRITNVVYVVSGLAAGAAAILADRAYQRGAPRADAVAQLGLGFIVGLLAMPSSSGLIALLALVCGVRSIITSRSNRLFALAALVIGIGAGGALLWIPPGRVP